MSIFPNHTASQSTVLYIYFYEMAEEAVRTEEDVLNELPTDAPKMPRYPTLIRAALPRGGTNEFGALTGQVPEMQPPPRFPSMPNVELSKAKALADPDVGSNDMHTDMENGEFEAGYDESVGRQLEAEIAETIERDAVEPGAAIRKASMAASKQWNSMDQRRLNSLLAGEHPTSPPPRTAPSVSRSFSRSAGVAVEPADIPETTPISSNTQSRSLPINEGNSLSDNKRPMTRSVPATGTMFPTALATIPMRQFSAPGVEEAEQVEHFMGVTESGKDADEEDDDINKKLGAMVNSTSESARVSIIEDYGLKNGHQGIINDSIFLNPTTLITGGNDGKVCIWNLEKKYIIAEFEPYNGNGIETLYAIDEDENSIITLSSDRLMRIWHLINGQAVLLRSMQIPPSNKDLVMNVPILTKQMKDHAAMAATAAAVTTSPRAETNDEDYPPSSLDADQFKDTLDRAPAYRGGIGEAMKERGINLDDDTDDNDNGNGNTDIAAATERSVGAAMVGNTHEEATPAKRFSFNVFGGKKKAVAS